MADRLPSVVPTHRYRVAYHIRELVLDPPIEDREFETAFGATTETSPVRKQLIEVTDDILAALAVGFDLPDDITADGAEAWLLRDSLGGVAAGSVRRFYRRGDDLAEVEERESAAVSTRRDLRFPTALGSGFLETDLSQLILHVPLRDWVTVVVRATSTGLLADLAQAMTRQPTGSDDAGMPLERARS